MFYLFDKSAINNQQSTINNLMSSLKSRIERLASLGEVEHDPDARRTFLEFRDQLTQGKIRAAEKLGGRDGRWTVTPGLSRASFWAFGLASLQT